MNIKYQLFKESSEFFSVKTLWGGMRLTLKSCTNIKCDRHESRFLLVHFFAMAYRHSSIVEAFSVLGLDQVSIVPLFFVPV